MVEENIEELKANKIRMLNGSMSIISETDENDDETI